MVHFSNLSLAGFKSFSDPCEIDIKMGLTGIVGPNGCGKSNLVEALRWIMGESSAKRMRGSEMDDVIFAGTVTRPPRNHAEVKLIIDNRDHSAPEVFNKHDTLEITRKIERGMGSEYRVNGKLARARDVQMLFADTSSGANSPAIVSQGRVADIIHAKPTDRRQILEDAAAISGLNSRRKEAEQRLQAAEKNLIQVDDILVEKEKLYQGMRKQARQALRYREISTDLRKIEGALFFHEWSNGQEDFRLAKEKIHTTHEQMEAQKLTIFDLKKIRDQAQKEATDAQAFYIGFQSKQASLQNERNNLIEQIKQIEAAQEQTKAQIIQIKTDIDHENALIAESNEKILLLDEEKRTLEEIGADFSSTLNIAQQERESARDNAEKTQDEHNRLTAEMAAQKQKLETLNKQKIESVQAISDLEKRLSSVLQEKSALEALLDGMASIDTMQKNVAEAEHNLASANEKFATAEIEKMAVAGQVGEARAHFQSCETNVTRLKTEKSTLASLLQEELVSDYPQVLDSIKVTDGYEKAVSVALGRELKASLDDQAPTFWQKMPLRSDTLSGLPKALKPLSDYITAPDELGLALSQIAVAKNDIEAIKHVAELSVGQWIVTCDGGAWRWDGYTIQPNEFGDNQTQAAAVRLEHRNRLEKITYDLSKAETQLRKAQALYDETIKKQQDIEKLYIANRTTVSDCYKALDNARNQLSKTLNAQAETRSKLGAAIERVTHFNHLLDEQKSRLASIENDFTQLPSMDEAIAKDEVLRKTLQEKRTLQRLTEERFAQINADFIRRKERLQTIEQDKVEWQKRISNSNERVIILNTRHTEAETQEKNLAQKPQTLKTHLDVLNAGSESLAEQEVSIKSAWEEKAIQLQLHETTLNESEEAINVLREEKARGETAMEAAKTALNLLAERAQKQFGCELNALSSKLDLDEEIINKEKHYLESQYNSLISAREKLGAINLRADEDARILFEELQSLTKEKEDILNAITELRQAISKLNSDARRRLMLAFNEVNRHFEQIFVRLFGGGKAHLELTNTDDPLEAGLEIFASPPGKKMQNLSLLSGGEQGLTAIALIFAMFRTTPSPICILDEIDAPLDDANVTRICDLLQDFTRECDTRFLIISHNAITMSRMHRLYGVTMGERGVSKIVSVDLQRHLDFMNTDSYIKEVA